MEEHWPLVLTLFNDSLVLKFIQCDAISCIHTYVVCVILFIRCKLCVFAIQSTGQSHSVTANYERILSLMKTHSPALCGRVPLVHKASFTGGISRQELACMLRDLEDEYALLQW